MRKYDLYGILNGVDYDVINPATESSNRLKNYDLETVFKDKIDK